MGRYKIKRTGINRHTENILKNLKRYAEENPITTLKPPGKEYTVILASGLHITFTIDIHNPSEQYHHLSLYYGNYSPSKKELGEYLDIFFHDCYNRCVDMEIYNEPGIPEVHAVWKKIFPTAAKIFYFPDGKR